MQNNKPYQAHERDFSSQFKFTYQVNSQLSKIMMLWGWFAIHFTKGISNNGYFFILTFALPLVYCINMPTRFLWGIPQRRRRFLPHWSPSQEITIFSTKEGKVSFEILIRDWKREIIIIKWPNQNIIKLVSWLPNQPEKQLAGNNGSPDFLLHI